MISLWGVLTIVLLLWYFTSSPGLLENGFPCRSGFDCISGTCCQNKGDFEPVCQQEGSCEALGIGENCVKDETVCQPGLKCCTGKDDNDWICRPGSNCLESNEGDECVKNEECSEGLTCCKTKEDRFVSHCKKPSACLKKDKSTCVKDAECDSFFCCGGVCSPPENCSPQPKEPGYPCTSPKGCLTQICCGGQCRETLEECKDFLSVGKSCGKGSECATNVCCLGKLGEGLTCLHPDDCLKDEGNFCNDHLDCKDDICCAKVNMDRKVCQNDKNNCLGNDHDDCSTIPCFTPLKCCKGIDSDRPAQSLCRPQELCLLNEGEECVDSQQCSEKFVCCQTDYDAKARCRSTAECKKMTCPVKVGQLQSCSSSKDTCATCLYNRVCTTLDGSSDWNYSINSHITPIPTGSWCLPPYPDKKCQPFVSKDVFQSDIESWGCVCKYPTLVSQPAFGAKCNQAIACKPGGALVNKDTFLPWTEESTWDPSTDGKCECSPGFHAVETLLEKKCVAD